MGTRSSWLGVMQGIDEGTNIPACLPLQVHSWELLNGAVLCTVYGTAASDHMLCSVVLLFETGSLVPLCEGPELPSAPRI